MKDFVSGPAVFDDKRGFSYESHIKNSFHAAGIDINFVQDNLSHSKYGVLRGLHFQNAPFSQTKLVRVLSGNIQALVVNIQEGQPTFGEYFSIELPSANKRQLLAPKGFAQGFLVLSEFLDVLYKCDEFCHPEAQDGIRYDDHLCDIIWNLPSSELVLTEKDLKYDSYPSAF